MEERDLDKPLSPSQSESQIIQRAWYREPLLLSVFVLVLVLLIAAVWFPDFVRVRLGVLHMTTIRVAGSAYAYLGIVAVLLCITMVLLPVGGRRMGGDGVVPDYSYFSWLAMLFSTGMGSGLLLRAVQEPVFYWAYHPSEMSDRKRLALEYTFFHWGLTPWAFYALFAVALMRIMFRPGGSVLLSQFFVISSKKRPCQNKVPQIHVRWWVDTLVVFGTLVGILASLGLTSQQIVQGVLTFSAGSVFPRQETGLWVLCVVLVSVVAWGSAYMGLQRGIQRLSTINVFLSLALLFWLITRHDVVVILQDFLKYAVLSFRDWWAMSLAKKPFDVPDSFLHDWTYFYWAFWLAWAPFTGIFIARISRGRTLRECLLGIVLVPSLASTLWFTVFAHASLLQIEQLGVYDGRFNEIFSAIFIFFKAYAGHSLIYLVLLVLLLTYLVTSLDSALFILSMYSSRGRWDPPRAHIVFWALVIPLVCLAVGALGRDHLLKTLSQILVLTSFPVSILLGVIMSVMVLEGIRKNFH